MNQRCLQAISILFLLLFLTGCAPAATPIPLPTKSSTPQPTATSTLTPEPTVTPTETPVEVENFPLVTPENYAQCVITPDKLEAYRTWLKTLSKPFPADAKDNKIKYNLAGHIVIDPSMARFDITICTLDVGDGAFRLLFPIEVKDVNAKDSTDSKNNIWLLTVYSIYFNDKQLSPKKAEIAAGTVISFWRKKLNSREVIVPGSVIFIAGYADPYIVEAQKQTPELQVAIEDFVSMKDLKGLGSKGVILLNGIYTSTTN